MDEVKTSQLKKIISADVTVMLYQQGDYVMAYCPALELSSYGKTEQEATAAFREALDIFLEYCGEQGTLEQNLIACGWDISVPIEFLKSQQLHSFDQKIALSVY
jgi:predicted RNase H-like HicB family nuclease